MLDLKEIDSILGPFPKKTQLNNVLIPSVYTQTLHLAYGIQHIICVNLFTSLSQNTLTHTQNIITMCKSMALTTTNNMLNQICNTTTFHTPIVNIYNTYILLYV